MVKPISGTPDEDAPRETERRAEPARASLNLNADDLDPVLGTLIWTRFARLVDIEKAGNGAGALLVVDLDAQSQTLATDIGERRDEILPLLVSALRQAVRQSDLITHIEDCRFAVLLLDAPQDVAASVASRILEAVESTIFFVQHAIAPLSVHVGGAVFGQSLSDEVDPLERATANLVQSQTSGHRMLIG